MIEEKIFRRMRADVERLSSYGFVISDSEATYSEELLGGDFRAEVVVSDIQNGGKVSGKVIDAIDNEEFDQLRNASYNGSFVNSVRTEYETLLEDIALKCFNEVTFFADQSNRITAQIQKTYNISPDFPWNDESEHDAGIFRHSENQKWFGAVLNIRYEQLRKPGKDGKNKEKNKKAVDVLNLKINPDDIETLCKRDGIYQGFHMNRKYWISVTMDETVPDDEVMKLVDVSFHLTESKKGSGKMDEEFILKVLALADSVPPGKVVSYGQLAALAGREKNSRMVGKIMSMADRYGEHPCHRVVNSAGRTVPGWDEQRSMLESEGVTFKSNSCVDMEKHRWNK